MITFEFKWTNQEPPHRYSPPAPAADTGAGGITRTVAAETAPTRALLPTPAGLKRCRPLSPPRQLRWSLLPELRVLQPPTRVVVLAVEPA
jgi:hypothetical protein